MVRIKRTTFSLLVFDVLLPPRLPSIPLVGNAPTQEGADYLSNSFLELSQYAIHY
jgi:hypothetical protein